MFSKKSNWAFFLVGVTLLFLIAAVELNNQEGMNQEKGEAGGSDEEKPILVKFQLVQQVQQVIFIRLGLKWTVLLIQI